MQTNVEVVEAQAMSYWGEPGHEYGDHIEIFREGQSLFRREVAGGYY